ncbi:adenylate/guanylate cyclase domain-containing protein, partial [Cribrihabitans sp. XS_ASV171]
DAYFAVAGVPVRDRDHAANAARFALDLLRLSAGWTSEHLHHPRFRVALASGPVVAGVIGATKFAYDVWGDTVNTASRIEHLPGPGEVWVTDETARRLGDVFRLTPLGPVELRGRDPVTLHRLDG